MKSRLTPAKLKNNEEGNALIIVLLAVVVISVLGLSMMSVSTSNFKMSTGERNYQSAYYIAESGITYEMSVFNNNIKSVFNTDSTDAQKFFSDVESNVLNLNNNITLPNGIFQNSFGQIPTVVVTVSKATNYDSSSNTRNYLITSIGTINNRSRKVQKTFSITWSSNNSVSTLLNKAVLVNGTIDLSGGGKGSQTINGDVGTNSSAPGSIIFGGNAAINGKIYVGPTAQSNVLSNNKKNYTYTPSPVTSFIMPTYPQTPPSGTNMGSITGTYTLNLNQDEYFSQISLANSKSLNINVTGNRNLIVDNLNLTNGFIGISGTGKLTIYVTKQFTMGSGSKINAGTNGQTPGNPDNLEIYYYGTSLSLSGSQAIYGSIFAVNNSAIITFSNGASMNGHLVSLGSSISFSGGTSANLKLLYAPYANVSLSGGTVLNGSVVANSISMSGGSVINYGIPSVNNLSFFQNSGSGGGTTIGSVSPIREIN
jgi:Tfp pilus assembly protein PilX